MPGLYKKQLLAISDMLKNPSKGIRDEGYYQLFKLWRENADVAHFTQDLLPIAFQHENLVEELRNQLNKLSINNSITDTFLKNQLETLVSEITKYKLAEQEKKQQDTKSNIQNGQTIKFATWQKVLAITILAVVFFISIINLIYVVPIKENTFSSDLVGLNINYKSPSYLSVHDENTVEISIENTLPKNLEGTLTLVFDDPEHSIKPARGENFSTEVTIHSHDKETQEFSFQLIKKPNNKNLNYHFLFITSDGSQDQSKKENFSIAPIPYLRSVSTWLFGSMGALIVTSLWDQIKKIGESATQKLLDQLKSAFLQGRD